MFVFNLGLFTGGVGGFGGLPQQQVTVPSFTFDIKYVITWIIIGMIAGFLAGIVVRGRRFGMARSVIIGLIGALIGGAFFTALRIPVSQGLQDGIVIRYIDIIVAFIGALIVLAIVGTFYRYRRY
jgi:uncharacterized membrane protein YeaQ/YmgE (transglycosylase-associated protein family)